MADLRNLSTRIEVDAKGAIENIEKVNKELDETVEKSKKVEEAAKTIGQKLKQGLANAGQYADKFGIGLMTIGGAMQKTGVKLTAATLPISMALKKAIPEAMSLDTALRKVSTLADSEILPVSKLKKEVREISDLEGIDQKDIAEGFYQALSSGVATKDVNDFVKRNVDLTRAGFTNMATAIDATTTVLNAYGDKAYDVTKIHDIFVTTQNKGKILVDDLAQSIGNVIPTAQAANINIDQLGAAYAILTNQGQNAQRATTNLNAMIQELALNGTKANTIIRQNTGQSFKELMANGKNIKEMLVLIQDEAQKSGLELSDMFGSVTAQKAAEAIIKSDFAGMRDLMLNSDGTTKETAETTKGDEHEWQQAMVQLKNTLMDVGKDLVPPLMDLVGYAQNLAKKYNALPEDTKKNVAKWIGRTVLAGPAMTLAGTGASVVGALFKGLGKILKLASGDTLLKTAADGTKAVADLAGAGGNATGAVDEVTKALSPIQGAAAGATSGLGALIPLLKTVGGLAAIAGLAYTGYKTYEYYDKNPKKAEESVKLNTGLTWLGAGSIGTSNPLAMFAWSKHQNKKKNQPEIHYYNPNAKSHRLGLTEVPYDNYLASLHEGERVLTKDEAREYSQDRYGKAQELHTHIEPQIQITINATESQRPMDIAKAVNEGIDDYFRNLRLQRV